MSGIVFGILCSLFQGIGYTTLKKSFKELPSSYAFLAYMLLGLLVWVPVSIVMGVSFGNIGMVFFYAFLSAILSEAFVFFVLSKGEHISITGVYFSTYPVFTILFSRIINGEIITSVVGGFVLITILGVLVIAVPRKFNEAELKNKLVLIYPLLGAIAVGISDTLSKKALYQTDSATFLFCVAFMQIPVSTIYLKLEKQKVSVKKLLKDIATYKYSLLGSFFTVISLIFFWLAFENTLASIASPLTATYPVFIVVLARIFLKEKVAKKDYFGIVVTVLGVVGIGYFYS
ncbi:MAG: DMT family transporter [Patescibacteria group bacterium]|nr:DMT family transporter [Patescibacteria group bacterium]